MTFFIRILEFSEKEKELKRSCSLFRSGQSSSGTYTVEPITFKSLPSSVFAYWMSKSIGNAFARFESFNDFGLKAQVGCSTKDDFRFIRLWWESNDKDKWVDLAKGGKYSPFYSDIHLKVNWKDDAEELEAAILRKYPYLGDSANWVLHRESDYRKPGITWTRRTKSEFSPRFLPSGCIFSEKGLSAFIESDDQDRIPAVLAILSSKPFRQLIEVQLAAADKSQAGGVANSYEVGIIKSSPAPKNLNRDVGRLAALSQRAWKLKYDLDSVEESSHAFIAPISIRERLSSYEPLDIEAELNGIQTEIDSIAFDLYEFLDTDRAAIQNGVGRAYKGDVELGDDKDDEDGDGEGKSVQGDATSSLLGWSVGVAFGRFDWRLATGERQAPTEPGPFDPLPTKSPGMLPADAEPFHAHAGILVDDEGHPHDLAYLLEEVLQRVDAPVQVDTRRWLQRKFFPFHLQRYSKSRRKAPIYWPLSTLSGAYTLWLYYPDLTSQTLFTAVNDFIEPKLHQVRGDLDSLRGKGNARSKQEEKQLEVASDLSQELVDLRDALLAIAPKYSPNHDDGVQITAAPLWQLFRHKPWQKVLNDTWEKLEQGDYDWSHLAMNYWPERVLRKCHQDRSLAIAHDVEDTFWHEVEVPVMRGKKPTGETKMEWQPKALTNNELDALIQAKIKERRA